MVIEKNIGYQFSWNHFIWKHGCATNSHKVIETTYGMSILEIIVLESIYVWPTLIWSSKKQKEWLLMLFNDSVNMLITLD